MQLQFLKNSRSIFFYLPVLWLATGMFWLPNGDKVLVNFVLLSALASIIQFGFQEIRNNWSSSYWIKVLAVSLLFASISYVIQGFGSRELRAIAISFVYLATLPASRISNSKLKLILIIACVNSFAIAAYFQLVVPTDRRYWPVNAIPFANYTSMIVCISLVQGTLERNPLTKCIILTACGLAFVATLLSQTRTALLALLIVLPFIIFIFLRKYKLNTKKIIISSLILCPMLFLLTSNSIINRYNNTVWEINQISSGNFNTSIGYRLSAYVESIDLIGVKPIFGHGKELQPYLDLQLKKGDISEELHTVLSWNFHNGYIEKLVVSGVVGLVFMISLLIYPFFWAKKQVEDHWSMVMIALSTSGIYLISNMVDTPFTNGHSLVSYLILVGLYINLKSRKFSRRDLSDK